MVLHLSALQGIAVITALGVLSFAATAQAPASFAGDGAFASATTPNLQPNLGASSNLSGGGGGGRSRSLRQQNRSLITVGVAGKLSPAAKQKAVTLNNAAAGYTSFLASSLPVKRLSTWHSATAGRGLGMGLNSGFSSGTLLGSSASKAPANSSSSNSTANLRAMLESSLGLARGGRGSVGGHTKSHSFQPPRSRFDKSGGKDSLRSRLLGIQR